MPYISKEEVIRNLKTYIEIIALCKFGSYGSKNWIQYRSNIDLIVVVRLKVTF